MEKMMFFSMKDVTPSSLFSAYASIAGSLMLFRSIANELIPAPLRNYLLSAICRLFSAAKPSNMTLVIEEYGGSWNRRLNEIYDAAEAYLCSKIGPHTNRLKTCKDPNTKRVSVHLDKEEKTVDSFEGIELRWRFVSIDTKPTHGNDGDTAKRFFELTFQKMHYHTVINSYYPFIIQKAKEIRETEKVLRMYTLGESSRGEYHWVAVNLKHPSTFETLAMEPEKKKSVMEDLDRFMKRRDFYKRVGRAWKRGYLLYGPPGTGKSSMVAAIANYLKFDIYDLQLSNVPTDSNLRKVLLGTSNKSILLIEDIDCSVDLPITRAAAPATATATSSSEVKRGSSANKTATAGSQLTLSGLLNMIDGLWSSCGDKRIIIFTTNHVEKLDPALLRPGRMDMHILMSYCTFNGFKILASNYLEISDPGHRLFPEIQTLMEDDNVSVTPAEIAEEFMKQDADVALAGLVQLLHNRKKQRS